MIVIGNIVFREFYSLKKYAITSELNISFDQLRILLKIATNHNFLS